MSYRVSRKFTSSSFKINGQFCKVFLEPDYEYRGGYWLWNLGFAIGKSRRQLNDWYWRRENKRRHSLDGHITGCSNMTAFSKGVRTMLDLRWTLPPGDLLKIDCTSKEPEKQFRSYWYWLRKHPEWRIDRDTKTIFWYRPPYPDDQIWEQFKVVGIIPEDRQANTAESRYYDCFRVEPKVACTDLSMEQMLHLLGQVLNN